MMVTRISPKLSKWVAYMGHPKDRGSTGCPSMTLKGLWLMRFGFLPGMSLTAVYMPGCAVFIARGQGEKPKRFGVYPAVQVSGKELALCGFIPGEMVSIQGDPGRITIKRLEVSA